jgi:hypothetical protein
MKPLTSIKGAVTIVCFLAGLLRIIGEHTLTLQERNGLVYLKKRNWKTGATSKKVHYEFFRIYWLVI